MCDKEKKTSGAILYCDGSCAPNKNAGFAAIDWLARKAYFGCKKNGTNNIAELSGIQLAFATIRSQKYTHATIYCDSQYAINVVTGVFKAHKNKELVAEIAAEYAALRKSLTTLSLEWVRGHAGTNGNEFADKCAKKATQLKTDDVTQEDF
jgi:ribonuclease HI